MYRSMEETNGLPPRVYRDPAEIRRDIKNIAARITEVKEMLNIRELISHIIVGNSAEDILREAEAMKELFQYATEALDELAVLSADLDDLKSELIETLSYY